MLLLSAHRAFFQALLGASLSSYARNQCNVTFEV